MLGSEVRGTAGGGRGRRAALSRDGRDGHHSKQQAQTASPRTARNRREEMNHKRQRPEATRERVDRGTRGPGESEAPMGPGSVRLGPRPRRQGSWIPPPPANRRAASRSHPAHATCPGPPFPPQAWTDQRRGQAQGANRNWLLMRLATKTNSLPPSLSSSSPSRPPSSPALFVSTAGHVLCKNHQQTNLPQESDGGNQTASQIDDGLVGVGPWHLGAATGRHGEVRAESHRLHRNCASMGPPDGRNRSSTAGGGGRHALPSCGDGPEFSMNMSFNNIHPFPRQRDGHHGDGTTKDELLTSHLSVPAGETWPLVMSEGGGGGGRAPTTTPSNPPCPVPLPMKHDPPGTRAPDASPKQASVSWRRWGRGQPRSVTWKRKTQERDTHTHVSPTGG